MHLAVYNKKSAEVHNVLSFKLGQRTTERIQSYNIFVFMTVFSAFSDFKKYNVKLELKLTSKVQRCP